MQKAADHHAFAASSGKLILVLILVRQLLDKPVELVRREAALVAQLVP
jgi:hypothetical protein